MRRMDAEERAKFAEAKLAQVASILPELIGNLVVIQKAEEEIKFRIAEEGNRPLI